MWHVAHPVKINKTHSDNIFAIVFFIKSGSDFADD